MASKAAAKKTTGKGERLNGPRLAAQPRLVVQGTSSLAFRGQTLLRIRPTLVEEVRSYCVGPMYLVIEHALEKLLVELRAMPEGASPVWVNAEDLEPTEHDKQILVDEGRLPKPRSAYADRSRTSTKPSTNEPASGASDK